MRNERKTASAAIVAAIVCAVSTTDAWAGECVLTELSFTFAANPPQPKVGETVVVTFFISRTNTAGLPAFLRPRALTAREALCRRRPQGRRRNQDSQSQAEPDDPGGGTEPAEPERVVAPVGVPMEHEQPARRARRHSQGSSASGEPDPAAHHRASGRARILPSP